jgi:hypothetical protein
MNPDQEKFEDLRKLMALKRHEQPPPAYLDGLTNRIIDRIESGEGRRNFWDRLSANFVFRPGMACAFGLTVCGALGFSGVYFVREQVAQGQDTETGALVRIPTPRGGFASQNVPVAQPLHIANWLRNTNPAESQLELSLFTTSHSAIPVSYEGY